MLAHSLHLFTIAGNWVPRNLFARTKCRFLEDWEKCQCTAKNHFTWNSPDKTLAVIVAEDDALGPSCLSKMWSRLGLLLTACRIFYMVSCPAQSVYYIFLKLLNSAMIILTPELITKGFFHVLFSHFCVLTFGKRKPSFLYDVWKVSL